jgi:hypothetical protein
MKVFVDQQIIASTSSAKEKDGLLECWRELRNGIAGMVFFAALCAFAPLR